MSTYRSSTPPDAIEAPEAVGVFDSFQALQAAMYDLLIAGFSRHDISMLGATDAMERTLGKRFWRSAELEDDPHAPRASFVSEEAIGEFEGAVAGGFFFLGSVIAMLAMLTPASTVAASIAAVAIGGTPGAAIGAVLARRIGQHHRDYYEEQIRHGGIPLWVRVADPEKERLAVEILKGHSGRDVHVHPWSE
jgi:hypothetical protein